MTLTVDELPPGCFEGEIPAVLATAAAGGRPNVGHVSQVYRVDGNHVAVSNQFLGKSLANLRGNPVAVALCIDPATLDSYRLLLRHVRTETSGPTFDEVDRSITAVAALTGMADVFALRSVEIFRVLHVEPVPTAGTAADR